MNSATLGADVSRSFIFVFICILTTSCGPARLTENGDDPREQDRNEKLECNGVLIETVFVSEYSKQAQDKGERWIKGRNMGSMTPYQGELSPEDNYNYNNLQANIQVGETLKPQTATHFTYIYQGQTYLYLIYKNKNETNQTTKVQVQLTVRGNAKKDDVIVSDERYELGKDTDTDLDDNYYFGNFEFKQFTDGAVIGPLSGDNWQILVEYKHMTSVTLPKIEFADTLVPNGQFASESLHSFLLSPARVQACELPQ
jgi:hypothetical protein